MNPFSKRLKRLRAIKQISQDELARISGIARDTIAKYESNAPKRPRPDIAEALAKALGSTPAYLSHGVIDTTTLTPESRALAIRLDKLNDTRRMAMTDKFNLMIDDSLTGPSQ